MNELQIGDEEWDKSVYIIGDAPKIRTLFSKDEQLRAATLKLINKKFEVEVTKKKIFLSRKMILRSEFESYFKDLQDDLDSICSIIENSKNIVIPENDKNIHLFRIFVFLLILFSVVTFSLSISSVEDEIFHLGGNSGFYGFVLGGFLGVVLLILWRFVRKLHSRSHYEFLSLAFAFPLGFGIFGSSSAFYLNRVLDTDHGYITISEITKKYSYKVKHGTVYKTVHKFKIPEAIISKPTFKVFDENISANEFHLLQVGDKRILRVYPGFFGQPWVQKTTYRP